MSEPFDYLAAAGDDARKRKREDAMTSTPTPIDSLTVEELDSSLQIARMAWGADSPSLKRLLPFLEVARSALSERSTNQILTAGIGRKAEEVTQGEGQLHHPAPECEGEIAARESLEPEGTAGRSGRTERLDGGERPASSPNDKEAQGTPVDIHRTPSMVGVVVNGVAYDPATLIGALAIELHALRSELDDVLRLHEKCEAFESTHSANTPSPNALKALADAVMQYDAAIRSCANDPEKMSSFCSAQGDDLDSLYHGMVDFAEKFGGTSYVVSQDK